MSALAELTIERICEHTGISRSTVYQYQRMGLLHPPVRIAPKKLRYDQSHLDRITEIKDLRNQKISLSEIQKQLKMETPQKSGTPSEDLKLQIMKTAADILARKGLSKTTISDITEAMGIGKGTFYLYFNSKEELFLESIERLPEIAIPDLNAIDIRVEKDFIAISKKRVMNLLQTFNVFSGISSIAKLALLGEDPDLAQKATRGFQNLANPVANELRQAITAGFFNEMDEDLVAYILYQAAEGFGYWNKMHPGCKKKKTIESVIDLLLNGIRKKTETPQEPVPETEVLVRDKNGNQIRISKPLFDYKAIFCGRLGQGELRIDFGRIRSINFKNEGEQLAAAVTLTKGKKTTIQVHESTLLSGVSSYGVYSIELRDIIYIDFGDGTTD